MCRDLASIARASRGRRTRGPQGGEKAISGDGQWGEALFWKDAPSTGSGGEGTARTVRCSGFQRVLTHFATHASALLDHMS